MLTYNKSSPLETVYWSKAALIKKKKTKLRKQKSLKMKVFFKQTVKK